MSEGTNTVVRFSVGYVGLHRMHLIKSSLIYNVCQCAQRGLEAIRDMQLTAGEVQHCDVNRMQIVAVEATYSRKLHASRRVWMMCLIVLD